MNKYILLSIVSGLLLGLPFCLTPLYFLIFFAWVPLLFLEEKIKDHHNVYLLFNFAFLSFSIWNVLSYWWVGKAQIFGVILIIILNSLLLALIFWLISQTRKSLKISIIFPFLIIWLGFEHFHTWWDLAWPWMNLGNAFASAPKWIQWYEFTGTRGGSLWIILINYCVFKIIQNAKNFRYLHGAVLLFLFGFPLLFSSFLYKEKENVVGTKSFALVQPNLDPYTEKFVPDNNEKNLNEFFATADSLCKAEQPDFLFGPETTILEPINEKNPNSSIAYSRFLELTKQFPNTHLMLGVHSFEKSPKQLESFNSALLLTNANLPEFYHKTRLVPLFERMPFEQYLGFLRKYSIEIGGYQGTYSDRNENDLFKLEDSLSLVPIVCFESIFGEYCAQRTPKSASFICMITNDGWWKNTPGYQHHFNFSRLRAIESQRHFVRVANNGISAHINSKGMIIASGSWWKKETLSGKISLMKGKTFYAEHGDYIGRSALFFAILLLIFVKIKTITQKLTKRTG